MSPDVRVRPAGHGQERPLWLGPSECDDVGARLGDVRACGFFRHQRVNRTIR
jgi:hypothetical protein